MQTLNLTKKYEKYSEYKNSGVEWLGKIPKEWQIQKARKFISRIESGVWGNEPNEDKNDIKCLRVADFDYERFTFSNVETVRNVPQLSKSKILKIGDILIEKSGGGEKSPVGRAIIFDSDQKMVCANFIDIVRVNESVIPKFLNYQLFSAYSSKLNLKSIKQNTGIQNLDVYSYFSEFFAIPSRKEQKEIVKSLDEKTETIDQIIEKKQKLIEFLREKRTSVINHEIISTKGELGKIKNYITVNPSKKVVSMTNLIDLVSFVPMEAISVTGDLELQEKTYKDVKDGFTYFENGDVVLAKITPCYENGKAGVMKGLKNGFGFGTTEFMVLRHGSKITADYLYYLIFSDKFRKSGEVEMRGTAGQKRVTASFVKNYEFTLPALNKQKEIVEKLNKKMELFDLSLRKEEKSIELLLEFKSSLISNVVTGKIKI